MADVKEWLGLALEEVRKGVPLKASGTVCGFAFVALLMRDVPYLGIGTFVTAFQHWFTGTWIVSAMIAVIALFSNLDRWRHRRGSAEKNKATIASLTPDQRQFLARFTANRYASIRVKKGTPTDSVAHELMRAGLIKGTWYDREQSTFWLTDEMRAMLEADPALLSAPAAKSSGEAPQKTPAPEA